MAILNVPVINSKKFDWENGVGVAERSSLDKSIFNRIYDDACDEGFAVVSAKTGTILVFAHSNTDSCADEEAGWRFTCVGEFTSRGIRLKPVSKEIEILVIND